MINFYFFPFTVMDACQANILFQFFNGLKILDIYGQATLPEAMAGLGAKRSLEPVCLDKEKLGLAEQAVRGYLDWAGIHKGNEKNLKAMIRENIFFKDDSGVAAICSGIRNGTGCQDTCAATDRQNPDPLVFLKLADLHDREHGDIQAALDALDQENSALLAELKGDEDTANCESPAQPFEPGQAMTEKRIEAWLKAALDAQLFDQEDTPILITTSRAVMEHFLTGAAEAINALDIDSIKVHENGGDFIQQQHIRVKATIEQMAEGLTPDIEIESLEDASPDTVTGRMQIRFFQGFGGVNLTQKNPGGQIGVCLVELNS